MKFEKVLPLMREGKKSRHSEMEDGEYWICGYAGMNGIEKYLTLIKMINDPLENKCTIDTTRFSWGIERWQLWMIHGKLWNDQLYKIRRKLYSSRSTIKITLRAI